MAKSPSRAHEFICKIGADTADGIIRELENFARRIGRNEMTAGVMGGSDVGSVYAYRHDPTMTHDRYFAELETILEQERTAAKEARGM